MAAMREIPELDERHVYVDASKKDDVHCAFVYRTIKEAVCALPEGTRSDPVVIYLKPDVYRTNGTATSVGLVINKSWLSLVGLGDSSEDTVIADARGHMVNAFPADNGHNSPAQTMIVNGDGFYAENLTIGNYLNIDLDYTLDPEKSIKKVSDVITQAYAIGSSGLYDCWLFKSCRIVGMLDTIDFKHDRVCFIDSLIEGTNDFMGGGERAVYKNCEFIVHDAHPMYRAGETATLFDHCHFDVRLGEPGVLCLTKFGGEVILDSCSFDGNAAAVKWAIKPEKDSRCYIRNVTLNNRPAAVSADSPENSIEITDEMSASLSAYNILQGDDCWNPTGAKKTPRLPVNIAVKTKPELELGESNEVSFETRPYKDIAQSFSEENSEAAAGLFVETLGAAGWYVEDKRLFIYGINEGETKTLSSVRISCCGVSGVCSFVSKPAVTEQPLFLKEPDFTFADSELKLDYELAAAECADCSDISWYRKKDGRLLAISRKRPCRSIRLTDAEVGSEIEVRIIPNTESSKGEREYSFTSRAVSPEDVSRGIIEIADFESFPTQPAQAGEGDFVISTRRPAYGADDAEHPADWEAGDPKCAWSFGRGINGAADSCGLVTAARGAALGFKHECTQNVRLTAILYPEKESAEGFGSANGQYLELLVGCSSDRSCGFGLRIEREPSFAGGCAFSLRRYENGVSRLMGEKIMSSAFLSPCTVVLSAANGRIAADVTTGCKRQPSEARKKNIPHSVHLEGQTGELSFGDVWIHHTGTVPPGNRTLLKSLKLEYRSQAAQPPLSLRVGPAGYGYT